VVVAAVVVVLWPRPERITPENYARVRTGMSRTQVEEILGLPGDYRTELGESQFVKDFPWDPDPGADPLTPSNWSKIPEQRSFACWISNSCQITVYIDDSGHVQEMYEFPRRTTQGVVANLIWRLKRQWHRWFPE
jgi:hypothetical protein